MKYIFIILLSLYVVSFSFAQETFPKLEKFKKVSKTSNAEECVDYLEKAIKKRHSQAQILFDKFFAELDVKYKEGKIDNSDYNDLLERLAETGYVNAQYKYAELLLKKFRTKLKESNGEECVDYLKKVIKKKHPQAQALFDEFLKELDSKCKGRSFYNDLLERSAETGYVNAQYKYAEHLLKKFRTKLEKSDGKECIDYLEKAIKKKHPQAQALFDEFLKELDVKYKEGKIDNSDYNDLLERSAQTGYGNAQYNYALYLFKATSGKYRNVNNSIYYLKKCLEKLPEEKDLCIEAKKFYIQLSDWGYIAKPKKVIKREFVAKSPKVQIVKYATEEKKLDQYRKDVDEYNKKLSIKQKKSLICKWEKNEKWKHYNLLLEKKMFREVADLCFAKRFHQDSFERIKYVSSYINNYLSENEISDDFKIEYLVKFSELVNSSIVHTDEDWVEKWIISMDNDGKIIKNNKKESSLFRITSVDERINKYNEYNNIRYLMKKLDSILSEWIVNNEFDDLKKTEEVIGYKKGTFVKIKKFLSLQRCNYMSYVYYGPRFIKTYIGVSLWNKKTSYLSVFFSCQDVDSLEKELEELQMGNMYRESSRNIRRFWFEVLIPAVKDKITERCYNEITAKIVNRNEDDGARVWYNWSE